MSIYTKTGDEGETSLLGGKRIKKDCIEMEAIGEIDELNASIGIIVSHLSQDLSEILDKLQIIQHRLFGIGSQLAAVQTDLIKHIPQTGEIDVQMLEHWIDEMDRELNTLTQFILPGGHQAAAQSFLARAVCRRAERVIIHMTKSYTLNPWILRYINRLSDTLFTLGRFINKKYSRDDVTWKR